MPAKDNSLVLRLSGPNAPRHFPSLPIQMSHRQQMAELECQISHSQTRLSSETILQFGSTDTYLGVFIFLLCVALCGLNMTFTSVLPSIRQVLASYFIQMETLKSRPDALSVVPTGRSSICEACTFSGLLRPVEPETLKWGPQSV